MVNKVAVPLLKEYQCFSKLSKTQFITYLNALIFKAPTSSRKSPHLWQEKEQLYFAPPLRLQPTYSNTINFEPPLGFLSPRRGAEAAIPAGAALHRGDTWQRTWSTGSSPGWRPASRRASLWCPGALAGARSGFLKGLLGKMVFRGIWGLDLGSGNRWFEIGVTRLKHFPVNMAVVIPSAIVP